jgi:hypothetical protein
VGLCLVLGLFVQGSFAGFANTETVAKAKKELGETGAQLKVLTEEIKKEVDAAGRAEDDVPKKMAGAAEKGVTKKVFTEKKAAFVAIQGGNLNTILAKQVQLEALQHPAEGEQKANFEGEKVPTEDTTAVTQHKGQVDALVKQWNTAKIDQGIKEMKGIAKQLAAPRGRLTGAKTTLHGDAKNAQNQAAVAAAQKTVTYLEEILKKADEATMAEIEKQIDEGEEAALKALHLKRAEMLKERADEIVLDLKEKEKEIQAEPAKSTKGIQTELKEEAARLVIDLEDALTETVLARMRGGTAVASLYTGIAIAAQKTLDVKAAADKEILAAGLARKSGAQKAELEKAKQETQRAQEEKTGQVTAAKEVQRQLEEAKEQAQEAQRKLDAKADELKKANEDTEEAQEATQKQKDLVSEKEAELNELNSKVTEKNEMISGLQKQVSEAKVAELDKEEAGSAEEKAALQKENEELKKAREEKARLEAKVAELQAQQPKPDTAVLKKTQKEVADLTTKLTEARKQTEEQQAFVSQRDQTISGLQEQVLTNTNSALEDIQTLTAKLGEQEQKLGKGAKGAECESEKSEIARLKKELAAAQKTGSAGPKQTTSTSYETTTTSAASSSFISGFIAAVVSANLIFGLLFA